MLAIYLYTNRGLSNDIALASSHTEEAVSTLGKSVDGRRDVGNKPINCIQQISETSKDFFFVGATIISAITIIRLESCA